MTEQQIIKKVGAKIRKIRLDAGMKQTDLAYQCGFEKQNMQRIEAGKTNPTLKTLITIAKALNVELIELLKV